MHFMAKYKKDHRQQNKGNITGASRIWKRTITMININKAIDFGVDIVQIQGNWCDWLVRDNKIEVIGK